VINRAVQRSDNPALRSTLVGCLDPRQGDIRAWRQLDPSLLVEAALQHGVAPALHLALRDEPDVPTELGEPLARAHAAQLFRHMRTLSEAERIAGVLAGKGIDWAVVKGPVLAEHVWPRPDMRMYGDLDLLVDRHRLGEVLAAMAEAEAVQVDLNWPMILQQMRAELTFQLPHGTSLDLHWDLVNEAELREVFHLRSELLQRRRTLPLGRMQIPTLDPVDTVLHLAYHTVRSGGHKLVWYRDLDLAVRKPDVDQDLLWRRSEESGTKLALAVAIGRAERLFGRPDGARRLPRSLWATVAASTEKLRPMPTVPGVRYSGQIVFSNTRDTSWASLLSAIRDSRRSREPRDWSAPNPLHEDVADASSRAQYLTRVQGVSAPRVTGV
jgi:hypothetical protein